MSISRLNLTAFAPLGQFRSTHSRKDANAMSRTDPDSTPADSQPRGALKLKPAAEYLGGLSIPTMHRLVRRGLLKPNRSLRHLIFPVSELDRFLRHGQ